VRFETALDLEFEFAPAVHLRDHSSDLVPFAGARHCREQRHAEIVLVLPIVAGATGPEAAFNGSSSCSIVMAGIFAGLLRELDIGAEVPAGSPTSARSKGSARLFSKA
jgi:hypothetical protein